MPRGNIFCGKCRHFCICEYGNSCRVIDTTRTNYQGENRFRFKPEVKNAHNNCDEYQYSRTIGQWVMEKLYNLIN